MLLFSPTRFLADAQREHAFAPTPQSDNEYEGRSEI